MDLLRKMSSSFFLKFLSLIVIVKSSVVERRGNQGTNAFYGSNQILTELEMIVNETIMEAKRKELAEGLITPHLFNPSQNFFDVVERINETDLFKLLRKMPKGGVLHSHDSALCSAEYLLSLTYWGHLWTCRSNNSNDFDLNGFKFSSDAPKTSEDCTEWLLLSELRNNCGAHFVDSYLLKRLSMNPETKFLDSKDAWSRFADTFRFVKGLLTYEPVWKANYKNALRECDQDGVQYLEVRTKLPQLYALNGTYFPQMHTAQVYHDGLQEFLAETPSFIGSKLIYAPSRWANLSTMMEHIEIAKKLKAEFSHFFIGFDITTDEDRGPPLKSFYSQLRNASEEINFYFHAGETNWFGTDIDENLLTAVDLGTKRIGHGFALSKYPKILQVLKEENIAIEVCPISNQVLQLVHDFRNHPCSHFFANNNPVVISSDDRSFWGAAPLSHDFYIAFLGIASAHSDLRFLKQLIANSIDYSAMNRTEKKVAFEKFNTKWSAYISDFNLVHGKL